MSESRTVIITGGTKGIGRGIAERFLAEGDDVLVCARKAPQSLPIANGRGAVFEPCDVRAPDDIDRVLAAARERFGRIDVLINNAGGSPFVEADQASPRFVASIVDLNLTAPLVFAQKAAAVMRETPGAGCIVNIASVSGTRPSPGTFAYGAAKAGLLNATRTLAVEWAPSVRVNAIVAGLIATEQAHLHYGNDAGIAAAAGTVPMGRLGTPADIADACVYLTSPGAAWVTGAWLEVHGGNEGPAFLDAVRRATGGDARS